MLSCSSRSFSNSCISPGSASGRTSPGRGYHIKAFKRAFIKKTEPAAGPRQPFSRRLCLLDRKAIDCGGLRMQSKNLLILVLVAFFALFFMGWTAEAEHQEEFQKVFPLSSQGMFSLKNVNGKVSISTWKEAKVEIKALKKTNKAAENLQKVKIEVTTAADSVSVDTVYPKHGNTGVSVDYDIKVPEGVNLGELSSVNGSVGITGPFGRVSASRVNGRVH